MAAQGFEDAADASFDKQCSHGYIGYIRGAVVFLYARSIELSLKACLRQHTADSKIFLKILGHRLDLILEKTEKLGICDDLGLSKEHRLIITAVGEDYADKWFEYPDNIWTKRPKIEGLKNAAKFLTVKTRSYVAPKNSKSALNLSIQARRRTVSEIAPK
jgi:HEPN domain-containing protein